MKPRLYFVVVSLILLPLEGRSDTIPPHLASMAAQLYQRVQNELDNDKICEARRAVLQQSINTLRQAGIERWTAKPVKIDGALRDLANELRLDLSNKEQRAALVRFLTRRGSLGTIEALRQLETEMKRPISQGERERKTGEVDEIFNTTHEKLQKIYHPQPTAGRSIEMKWVPETDQFFMKVLDDGSSAPERFATTFSGNIEHQVDKNGEALALEITPSDNALSAMTASDLETYQDNILGQWTDRITGEVYHFTASDEEIGSILPPRAVFDEQIERIRDKIDQRADALKSVRDVKIFKWKNSNTGKIVRQEKYRRLKEPFEFIGQELALENGAAEIARIEKEITTHEQEITALENERDGKNLPPVDKHDPTGFDAMRTSSAGRALTIEVQRPDGYSYTYDHALFDGRRITAKRTYRDLRDLTNDELPERIQNQLINNGWNPPGWLELDVTNNAETGALVLLEGGRWSLKVTYSSFFGDAPDVDSIHSPGAASRVLSSAGAGYKVAEGAAANFVP